jgi:hypothetical protein
VTVAERALALVPAGSDGHPYLQGLTGDLTIVEIEDPTEMRRAASAPWRTVVVAAAGEDGVIAGQQFVPALPPDGCVLVDLRDAPTAASALRPLVPTGIATVGARVVVRFEHGGRAPTVSLEEQLVQLVELSVMRARSVRDLLDQQELVAGSGARGVRARGVAVARGVVQLGGIGAWWLRSRRSGRARP